MFRLTPIRALQVGVPAQVEGTVEAVERGFRYRPVLRVAIGDDSRATLVLRQTSAEALAQWLADARANARANTVEARLTRADDNAPGAPVRWNGTLTLALP